MSISVTVNEFARKGAMLGLERSNFETAVEISAQAKALCSVDYGQLRNTIMAKSAKEEKGFNKSPGGGGGGLTPGGNPRKGTGGESAPQGDKLSVSPKGPEAYAGTNSDHWHPEFGTRFQEAQPFLRPAGDAVRGVSAKEIGLKYGREAMAEEFRKRKVTKRELRR